MENHVSKIVTFYSYKGGVGRSMAMANVAWLLAEKYGRKVLMIDWDLEAPGLHKYFDLRDENINKGLIDLLRDYKKLVSEKASLPDELFILRDYIKPIKSFSNDGSISILPAGRQDDGQYKTRVNEFNWEEFYDKWHGFGFMEYFKKQLKLSSEIILIDSRTGVTDHGAICTLQLPDVVVLLFALNEQNLKGIESVVQTILTKAPDVAETKRPPALVLRASRVEILSEVNLLGEWQRSAASRLGRFFPQSQQHEALTVIETESIPYVGFYSFGETPLAVRKAPLGEPAKSFENLTKSVLEAAVLAADERPERITIYGSYLQARDRLRSFSVSTKTALFCLIFVLILAGGTWLYYYKARQVTQLSQQVTSARQEAATAESKARDLQASLEKLKSEIVISDIRVGDFNCGEATIEWITSKDSSSQVTFGPTNAYGQIKTGPDTNMTTVHSVILQDLIAGTEYHYQVQSRAADGTNAKSSDLTFTMPPKVLIFIHFESQRAVADQIHDELMGQKYDVCDVEIDRGKGPDQLEVRFFLPENGHEADVLLRLLRDQFGLSDSRPSLNDPSKGDPGRVFDIYFRGSRP